MPTADQLFYGTLRASPARRAVSPAVTMSRGESIRRAKTPTACGPSRGVKRSGNENKVVKSTNVTTAAPSLSQRDNQFSAVSANEQRSTPNFTSSSSSPRLSMVGVSLGTDINTTDTRRHAHQWSTVAVGQETSTIRGFGVSSSRRTSRDVFSPSLLKGSYSNDDDGAPKLRALEKTLESEMLELRVLTDKLETRMASVMSLEDQRKALARMIGRSWNHRVPSSSIDKKKNDTPEETNDTSARSPPRQTPPVTVSVGSPLRSPPQNEKNASTSYATPHHSDSNDSTVLSVLPSAIALTDSGRKRHQFSDAKRNGSNPWEYNNCAAHGPNASAVMLMSSSVPRNNHKSETSIFVGRGELRSDVDDEGQSNFGEEDDRGPMVIDFSSVASPPPSKVIHHSQAPPCASSSDQSCRSKKPEGHLQEVRSDSDSEGLTVFHLDSHIHFVEKPSASSPTVTSPVVTHAERQHHRSPEVSLSTSRSTENVTTSPHHHDSVSVSSAGLLLAAQAHGLKGDLLKYEEDLLLLQDELIRTQRLMPTACSGGGEEDDMERALLMHLRLVLRDELSSCKQQEQTLDSLADRLSAAR